MSAWLSRLRKRPISERERPWVLVLVALALSGVTLALALARPARNASPGSPKAVPSRSVQGTVSAASVARGAISPQEEQVSDAFLAGYLAYVYGHSSLGEVHDATGALLRLLDENPPRDPPAMQGLDPRVVSLRSTGSSSGAAALSALISDGGLIDYRVELRLVHRGPALLVSEVGQG